MLSGDLVAFQPSPSICSYPSLSSDAHLSVGNHVLQVYASELLDQNIWQPPNQAYSVRVFDSDCMFSEIS